MGLEGGSTKKPEAALETLKESARDMAERDAKNRGEGYSAMEVPSTQKPITLYNEYAFREKDQAMFSPEYNQPLRIKAVPLYFVVNEDGMPVAMYYKRSDSHDIEFATAENGKWCRQDD